MKSILIELVTFAEIVKTRQFCTPIEPNAYFQTNDRNRENKNIRIISGLNYSRRNSIQISNNRLLQNEHL